MDEMEQRLRAATDTCVNCHAEWRKDPKEATARGGLMEAVHELRKIAARLEIEIAVSERDEMAAKPVPIPPHRSSRKGGDFSGGDDNIGNMAEMDDPNDRQPSSNRSGGFRGNPGGGNNRGPGGSGGGGGGQGGPRRRMGMGGPQGGNNRPPPPSSDDQN